MTSPNLLPDLRRDEDLRLAAYPDPISHGAPFTIGFGHTGREVHPGLLWSLAQAEAALEADVRATETGLDTSMSWWRGLDDIRQDCLVNQAFNMGVHGLLGFATYLKLVQWHNYAAAADDELHTLWAEQVGARAHRLAEQMRTGIHVP